MANPINTNDVDSCNMDYNYDYSLLSPYQDNIGTITYDRTNYNSNYFDTRIMLNDTLELKTSEKCLMVVKNLNLVIIWNEIENKFDLYKIKNFEQSFENFKLNNKTENNKNKTSITSTNTSVYSVINSNEVKLIKSLCDNDESFYIDLESKEVYKYSEKDSTWNRQKFNNFKLEIYKNSSLKNFFKKRKERNLLVEKMTKDIDLLYVSKYAIDFDKYFNNEFILERNARNLNRYFSDYNQIYTTTSTTNLTGVGKNLNLNLNDFNQIYASTI